MAKAPIPEELEVGKIITLTPERVAHGGSFVARAHDRVIFVRHTAIGETVRARITGVGAKNRFFFADTVEVLEPSEHRRPHPWAPADALAQESPLGGMEFGHLNPDYQRELKTQVVREHLERLGGLPADFALLRLLRVEALSEEDLGWRTRVHFAVSPAGRVAMYPHSSSQAREVEDFPLAHKALRKLNLSQLDLTGAVRLDATVSSTGEILLVFAVSTGESVESVARKITEQAGAAWGDLTAQNITLHFTEERVGGRRRGQRQPDLTRGAQSARPTVTEELDADGARLRWKVGTGGFWQIHPQAPAALTATVAEMLELSAGETVFDLYSGAGLFTAMAAVEVGAKGSVLAVEGSAVTSANARENFASGLARIKESEKTPVEVVRSDVGTHLEKILPSVASGRLSRPSAVILDPSREGAGKKVMEQCNRLAPSRLVYVACDPAALGRDTGYLRQMGWEITALRAFDMYPNTHHVETVALFEKR